MYQVTLSHAKNPDIAGGYWNEAPTEGRAKVQASTMQEAAALCRAYIERNGLGGGNWTGGKVYEGKKQVTRVSYNGRVWAMDGSEIKRPTTNAIRRDGLNSVQTAPYKLRAYARELVEKLTSR